MIHEALNKRHLIRHLSGAPAVGLAPIVPGTNTTKIAVLDFDSHDGAITWDKMRAVAKTVYEELQGSGLIAHPFRSSGGRGVHLILVWAALEDAYSVREKLRLCLSHCGLKSGTKGIRFDSVEIFPKSDSTPADRYGSMFVLPWTGQSVQLDTNDFQPQAIPLAKPYVWEMSQPVEVLEHPLPPMRTSPAALAPDLAKVRAALEAIPNDGIESLDYDSWRDVGFAVHHATGGSEEGRALFHEWSARSPKYDPEWLDERFWPYVDSNRENAITARTLFSLARAHEDPATDFEVLPEMPTAAKQESPATPSGVPDASSVGSQFIDPNTTRIGDFYTTEPAAPKFIVSGALPVSAGTENAIGGAGKSTRHLYEAAHIILGRPLYGYPVERPGSVLLATREDNMAIVRYRMNRVCRALELSDADAARVAANFHVLDLVGTPERLVSVDRAGNLVRTKLAERICRSFEREGIVLIDFDPINLLGPGERFVNDGEAAVLDAGHAISRDLGCAVRFTSHVSKVVGREGIVDAHSGRGGSALGDNARFVWNYLGHEKEHKDYKPPISALDAAERGDLYRLHITKLSWAQRPRLPIWIEREGWSFKVHQGHPESSQDRLQAASERVAGFLEDEGQRGVKYSRRSIEEARERVDKGLTRDRLRDALNELERIGRLREIELPPGERQGQRKTYLAILPASLEVQGV
jgi:hypothetical protein